MTTDAQATINNLPLTFEIDTTFILTVLAKSSYYGKMDSQFFRNYYKHFEWISDTLFRLKESAKDIDEVKEDFVNECEREYKKNNRGKNLKWFYFTLENYLRVKKITLDIDLLSDVIEVMKDIMKGKAGDYSSVEFAIRKEALLEDINKLI